MPWQKGIHAKFDIDIPNDDANRRHTHARFTAS